MTCSDYLPAEGRNCQRPATVIVEIGSRAFPKCARHAARYENPVIVKAISERGEELRVVRL